MTFYIKELIFKASDESWDAISNDRDLRPYLCLLRNTEGQVWNAPNHKHDYSDDGLYIVRPICAPDAEGYNFVNKDGKVLNPNTLKIPQSSSLDIDYATVQSKTDLTMDGFKDIISLSLLFFAKKLSEITGEPVLYYDALFWGGQPEHEIAWIFGDEEEVVLLHKETMNSSFALKLTALAEVPMGDENILKYGLEKLGCSLSNGFFLPHTRGFDWAPHRVR